MKTLISIFIFGFVSSGAFAQGLTEEEMVQNMFKSERDRIPPADRLGHKVTTDSFGCFVLPLNDERDSLESLGLPERICPGAITLTLRPESPFESAFIEFAKNGVSGTFEGKYSLQEVSKEKVASVEGYYTAETPVLATFSKRLDGDLTSSGSVKLRLLIDKKSAWIHTSRIEVMVSYSVKHDLGYPSDRAKSGTVIYSFDD